jgi:hypothetical protein
VRDVDRAAGRVHEVADRPGHGGLAVTRRAVDEHALAGDDRRADGVEQLVFQHQVREMLPQRFGAAADAGDRLPVGLLDVVSQRHRAWADIGALLGRVLGPAAAEVREDELVRHAADQFAAGHLDALLVLEEADPFLDDLERQTHEPRQVQAEHQALLVQSAEDHVGEQAHAQAGFPEGFRRGRRLGQAGQFHVGDRRFLSACHAIESPARVRAMRPRVP